MADLTLAVAGLGTTTRVGFVGPIGQAVLSLPVLRLALSGAGAVPRVQFVWPTPSLVLSGLIGASGSLTLDLPLPRLALAGPNRLALALPTPGFTAQALAGGVGALNLSLPVPVGVVLGPDTLGLVLPAPGLSVAGSTGMRGDLTLNPPALRLSLVAQVPYTAAAALALPVPQLSVAGTTGQSGRLAGTLRGLALSVAGHTGVLGALSLTLPLSTFTAGGYQATAGAVQLVLPHLQLSMTGAQATARAAPGASNTLVMHTEALSLSTYSNFPFNSFASFNGLVLAAGPDGIVSLGGATDAGAPIQASARVGVTDFGTSHLKRVDRVYVGYRTDGDLVLRVFTDEINQRDYRLEATGRTGLHGNHLRIGRGLAARYWQFEVRNLNGADFQLDLIELKPTPLRRRVGGGDA